MVDNNMGSDKASGLKIIASKIQLVILSLNFTT